MGYLYDANDVPLADETVILYGLSTVRSVTTSSIGKFTLQEDNLVAGEVYNILGLVSSSTYISSTTPIGSITIRDVVTIELPTVTQVINTTNIQVSGYLRNLEGNPIASEEIILYGFVTAKNLLTESDGKFLYEETLDMGESVSLYACLNTNSNYTAVMKVIGSITIKSSALITSPDIIQVSGTDSVIVSGYLYDFNGATISNEIISIIGFSEIRETITDLDGKFMYQEHNLLSNNTYIVSAILNSEIYMTELTSVGSIKLITPGIITYIAKQIEGTTSIIISGHLKDLNNNGLNNVSFTLTGFTDEHTLITDNLGAFTYQEDNLSVGSVFNFVLASTTTIYSINTINIDSITIKQPLLLSNPNIIQNIETLTMTFSGLLTDENSIPISNENILITGLASDLTLSTDENGEFSYTTSDLIINNIYSLTANIISDVYSTNILSFETITIKPNAFISAISFNQIIGTRNITLSGQVLNNDNENVINETISIFGFGSTINVTTNSDGIFNYLATNLTPTQTYIISVEVPSVDYSSNNLTFGSITIKTPATIEIISFNQVIGTRTISINGKLKDDQNNNINNELININGFTSQIQVTTNTTGNFSCLVSSLIVGNEYNLTADVLSNIYTINNVSIGTITILTPVFIVNNTFEQINGQTSITLSGSLKDYQDNKLSYETITINGFNDIITVTTNIDGDYNITINDLVIRQEYTLSLSLLSSNYTTEIVSLDTIKIKEPVIISVISFEQVKGTQTITLTGSIKDNSNNPINNVSIKLFGLGSNIYATSNEDGEFSYTT